MIAPATTLWDGLYDSSTLLEELKRYVHFGPADEAALRELGPHVLPQTGAIIDEFYKRLEEHPEAKQTLDSPERIERHRAALRSWIETTLTGPWDQAYLAARLRIGEAHVRVGLAQRYMFCGMDVIRLALTRMASDDATGEAINKICDIELAIMLHAYGDAFVRRVRELERREKAALAERVASMSRLAAGLAHEIRNPLNSAHLQLELARRRLSRLPENEAKGALAPTELVSSELSRLAALLDEFLQFARPQVLRRVSVDLRETAEAVLALLLPEAEKASVALVLRPGPPAPAEVDEDRIKQVLMNLMRNAIEAVGPGGHVELAAESTEKLARLEVCDDGPGIPPGARLFEPFFTTKSSGTGLGLTIVHRIVTDHDGRVDVDSQPGSTVFTVTLPRVA
jgi:signal transduction histidine kinase